jgi:4-amino-4-deoxy-L-arabinose transferase-like glycosyltransferase
MNEISQGLDFAPAHQSSVRPESYGARLCVLLLALLALRAAGLFYGKTNLSFDEAQYWVWSKELAFGYFSKPPLLAAIIRIATTICGDGEVCIRMASPVLHTATALVLYLLANRLYDRRCAFWAAIVYATMPGVAFSSLLITTDVPLLLFWSVALLMLTLHIERPRLATAIGFGLAFGLGLNAKYAMLFLLLCSALYVAATPKARPILRAGSTWIGLGIGVALIAPNMMWNWQNGFVTFHHTVSNADWRGGLYPSSAAEFLGSQFAVFGPIGFGVLIAAAMGRMRSDHRASDSFLLFHSIPVLLLILVQAFKSRADANWAGTAFPAASVLTTALMLRAAPRLFLASLAVRAAVVLPFAFVGSIAPSLSSPTNARNPFKIMMGWKDMATGLQQIVGQTGIRTVVVDGRDEIGEAIYYLRDRDLDIRAFRQVGRPAVDYFQMTRPWSIGGAAPVLFVTPRGPESLDVSIAAAVRGQPMRTLGIHPMNVYRLEPVK